MPQLYQSSRGLQLPTGPMWTAPLGGRSLYLRTPRTIAPTATRRPFPRRGLGQGDQTAVAATKLGGQATTAGLNVVAQSSSNLAESAAAAIPIVGAVVAIGALLASFLGGGCGEACIESSQAEQIYEVACDDLTAVAKLGMLAQSDYANGIQTFVQAGIQHLQSLQQQGDSKAAAGITNLQKSTQGNVSYESSVPAAASVPLNLTTAQNAFIAPNESGWYAASITAGNQLALAYLQSLPSASAGGSSALSVSPTGSVMLLGQTFSIGEIILALALIAGVVYFAS